MCGIPVRTSEGTTVGSLCAVVLIGKTLKMLSATVLGQDAFKRLSRYKRRPTETLPP